MRCQLSENRDARFIVPATAPLDGSVTPEQHRASAEAPRALLHDQEHIGPFLGIEVVPLRSLRGATLTLELVGSGTSGESPSNDLTARAAVEWIFESSIELIGESEDAARLVRELVERADSIRWNGSSSSRTLAASRCWRRGVDADPTGVVTKKLVESGADALSARPSVCADLSIVDLGSASLVRAPEHGSAVIVDASARRALDLFDGECSVGEIAVSLGRDPRAVLQLTDNLLQKTILRAPEECSLTGARRENR